MINSLSLAGHLIDTLRAKVVPIAYAKGLGVHVGERVRIFSLHPGAFGSEPYLVTLGNDVIVTAGVRFITHDGSTFIFRDKYPDLDVMGPIHIGNNTFIGSGSTILPGVSIGPDCVVGAMSLVTRPVPAGSVVAGSPARVVTTTESFLDSLLNKNARTGAMGERDKRSALMAMASTFDKEGREWLVR